MDVKEYIEKHNIDVPLEAIEEFERDCHSVIDSYPDHEVKDALALLLKSFREKYKTSPVVKDYTVGTTGVLNKYSIKIPCQGNRQLIPNYTSAYPIENEDVRIMKASTESLVVEDQTPILAEELAQLELQKKYESYSKRQWITVDDGAPARFVALLKHSEQPFVLVKTWRSGEESVFIVDENLCENYELTPCIKEAGPYANWKIDAPVIYWDGAYERHAHYAGTDHDGNATIWHFGGTSWTTSERSPAPDFVELAEDEK